VVSVNPSWWKLKGFEDSSIPPESDYLYNSLQEVLKIHSTSLRSGQVKIIEHILNLIPRLLRGIPVRVPYVSLSATGKKVLSYLRMVPLVNERMEISFGLITLHESSPSPHIESTVQEDTIISPQFPINKMPSPSTSPPSLHSPEWNLLKSSHLPHGPPGYDPIMYSYQVQGSPSVPVMMDPIWGTTIPRPYGAPTYLS
jgi:hypothetical protein